MVSYVTDTSAWQPWQRDYRLGLILILPPPEIAALIDPLRAKYDPGAAASCPTHISVSDLLRLEMTSDLDAEVVTILADIPAFRLTFDRPRASASTPVWPIRLRRRRRSTSSSAGCTRPRSSTARSTSGVTSRPADDRGVRDHRGELPHRRGAWRRRAARLVSGRPAGVHRARRRDAVPRRQDVWAGGVLFPGLRLGWLNGWILLAVLFGVFGLLLVFSKPVVKGLYA